ncbi:MAG: hypothetical protein H0W65_08670 [Sphingomonas sp.]|uniref:tetratricopeptide repeat protein n=1 Tax=Sphingomonas sp. TaxID=28214 RepID=UPI0017E2231E|nr:tetratricopeptide repeat protein [Sphingomonas sp.]MBA3667780.1 hypothetical protein [Sphingomonas sp.]
MNPTHSALAFVLALGATPALAQYGPSAPPPQVPVRPMTPATAEPTGSGYKPVISNQARKEIVELQTAVNAKDVANIPAKLAAAQAKAKTKDDKYVIARLQLKAALDANDNSAMAVAIEGLIASGAVPSGESVVLYNNLGKLNYNAKAYDKAGAAFERVLQIDPVNQDALIMLGETRNSQGRAADGVTMIQKAIAARRAAGGKPDEAWYKRAVALAYNANLPAAPALARDWASAYPSPKNWRDAIRIYQTSSKLPDDELLDSMRLAQAAGALTGENDYFRFANTLVSKGFPGEAKTVLDQGFAANTIKKSSPTFAQLYGVATVKSQGDRASLAASAKTALAGAAVRPVMVTADAYYGYGDYAEAASLYRAALTKSGADKNLANLRLGMALARSGDKAGATLALGAVGGAQAEVAKLWLAYLATKA